MTPVGVSSAYMKLYNLQGNDSPHPPNCSVHLHKQANITWAAHVTGTSLSVTALEERENRLEKAYDVRERPL